MKNLLGRKLSLTNNRILADSVTRYVLHLIGLKQVKENCFFLTKKERIHLKDLILDNYDVSVVWKIGMLKLSKKEFNIDALIRFFYENNADWLIKMLSWTKMHLPYKAKMCKTYKTVPMPSEIRAFAQNELLQNKNWIGRFIGRKFAFLTKRGEWTQQEIMAELQLKAVQTVYFSMPFKSLLYVRNVMKRAIHNSGINFLKTHSTSKRSRLTRTENGFESRIVSDIEGKIESLPANAVDNDLYISVKSLLSNASLADNTALSIFSGHHKEFYDFCKSRGYKGSDSDDLLVSMGSKTYREMARQFLGWSPMKMDNFISHVTTQIT